MTRTAREWQPKAVLWLAATLLVLCAVAHSAPRYKVLHSFTGGADGIGGGAPALDSKGNLYGASLGGGSRKCGPQGCGLIYELTPRPDGKFNFAVLYDFTGGNDAGAPRSPLFVGGSGNLYGATTAGGARGGGTVFELSPDADGWTLTTLYSFCNQQGCLLVPRSGVVRDSAGNLYGTTPEGGAYAHGGAFEVSPGPDGKWTGHVLHQFPASPTDGSDPYAGLILDASGDLYGTTGYGGTGCEGEGCGTVYELSPEADGKWKETILHRFDNNGGDGVTPGAGALFMDSSGNLYGTTEAGGSNGGCAGGGAANRAKRKRLAGIGNCGTVFKLTKDADGGWSETLLYNFALGAGGYLPDAGVVMDKVGNLYGTTVYGGGPNGCGVLYKLAPGPKDTWKYTVLHLFGRVGDGCLPSGNLAIDSKGNLYGGTILGGTHGNGVVFELTP